MYFVEWLMRRTLTASKRDITGFEGDMKQFEKATEKYGKQYRGMQERTVSDAPSDARSIYKTNDTYMDVRTFFDEWRGGGSRIGAYFYRDDRHTLFLLLSCVICFF